MGLSGGDHQGPLGRVARRPAIPHRPHPRVIAAWLQRSPIVRAMSRPCSFPGSIGVGAVAARPTRFRNCPSGA